MERRTGSETDHQLMQTRPLGLGKQPTQTKPKRRTQALQIGVSGTFSMQFLHEMPAHAAWDLRHTMAVDDLLKDYLKTLPAGATMAPPRLFVYQGTAFSRACPNSGIDAPAYCPGDHTIYLETGLGDQVAAKFGDFGALSILAHEYGHADLFKRKQHPEGKYGELAADNFAGGFARFVEQKGYLDPGDIDEARATFAAVGDYEVYHHDHHGTPAERRQAFEQGYQQGFRLPGDAATPPTTPLPPAQAPGAPPTAEQNPPPPIAPLNNGASPVIPLLGLGMGGLLLILIVVGVINMINQARIDD